LGCTAVKNAMRRDRFLKLKKYLHIADNEGIPTGPHRDHVYKLRPLYNILNHNFMRSMVPYYGGHSLRIIAYSIWL
jgi:hypothetical protein